MTGIFLKKTDAPAECDFREMYSPENLRLAFRRICTNPEAFYKNFFRDAYQAYSVTLEDNLQSLSGRLATGTYLPTPNERLFLPKAECLIRPHAILTVEDQIVYQACANIVAEKLHPHVSPRYGRLTFGHMYAGRDSDFFYRDWKKGYRLYGRKVRTAVKSGFKWVATFDVTACYDSIDHAALQHYLLKFGVGARLTDFILDCLSTWSCVGKNDRIKLHRGIPQGPLSSGIFAEVILQHLDTKITMQKGRPPRRHYFRYVDDIRIYGANQETCTQALIRLDISARQIGLFCQGSKTGVRLAGDYRNQIKTISLPEQDNVTVDAGTPYTTIERNFTKTVNNLIPEKSSGEVKAETDPGLSTKIKYLAHRIRPSVANDQLMKQLFDCSPSTYYRQFCAYLERHHEELSGLLSHMITEHITKQDHFDAINARLMEASLGRLPAEYADMVTRKCLKKPYREYQPVLQAASLSWLLHYNALDEQGLHSRLEKLDWWSFKEVIRRCPDRYLKEVIHTGLQSAWDDTARCAALKMLDNGIDMELPERVNACAEAFIELCRVPDTNEARDAFINASLAGVLEGQVGSIPWHALCAAVIDEMLIIARKLRISSGVNRGELAETLCRFFLTAREGISECRNQDDPVADVYSERLMECATVLESFINSCHRDTTAAAEELFRVFSYRRFQKIRQIARQALRKAT